MGKTLREKMAGLDPDRRARIEAEADRLHAEYLTLQDLRKAKELTQVQLAETLGIRQATVAQMEKRGDLMLSTLRSYVEAMGGHLRLVVDFPDRPPVSLEGLGDTEEPPRRRGHRFEPRPAPAARGGSAA
jgi:DNA-binding XRE family transcriptional regulator